ncbi:MAG TPA: carbohydrate kinase family protein [Anaerolineaceae bacterium]|nr:carbohydrate kinase family protein [Chloroflexota bacterium]HNY83846.1 carbohydrate kinase family protein [Anaerolineaceae bacterium]
MILDKEVKIVSIGDLVMDINLSIQKLPIRVEEHQMLRSINQEPGGAGNFLIAGQRLGAKMVALGAVGDDFYGHEMLRILKMEGVDISHAIVQPTGSTTVVYTLNDPIEATHVFLGYEGVGPLTDLSEEWKEQIRTAGAIQAYGYTLQEKRMAKTMIKGMRYAKEHDKPVFFDPGPYVLGVPAQILDEALESASALILTEDEIKYVLPEYKELQDARAMFDRGLTLLVIKQGPEGCLVMTPREEFKVKGFVTKKVDSTAAGDSFGAAFIAGMLQGWPFEKVMRLGNAMGAAKVSKQGSGRQVPTLAEVEKYFYSVE